MKRAPFCSTTKAADERPVDLLSLLTPRKERDVGNTD